MKAILGVHTYGSFLGSPDHDYYFVDDELLADAILHSLISNNCKRFDTYDDAHKELKQKGE